jgi:ubiquinone biosynthesis accessory factor UbiK
MMDYESLSQKLLRALPPHLKAIEEDIQQQFKTILSSAFAQLDIVTREEFDVQARVLARTREKVEVLEQQLKKLLEEKNC